MGTRNLTMVILDGRTRVAQYGQWDGYPSGQGMTALKFLRNNDMAKFRDKVAACWFGDEKELADAYREYSTNGGMNLEQHRRFIESPVKHLSRDQGAKILELIYESDNGLMLQNSESFAADSLMNEWTYVIDLDKKTFEVYKGFNHSPLAPEERFFHLEGTGNDDRYHPVKHLVTFNLENLPSEEDFLKKAEPPEDE